MRLVEAKELTTDADLAQSLISGGARDPYVIFAMNEENEQGPKEGAIGLGRAVDQVRSSTVWSESIGAMTKAALTFGDKLKEKEKDGTAAEWPQDERPAASRAK